MKERQRIHFLRMATEGCVCDALDYPQNVQMTITKGSGRNSMFTNCRARNNRSHRFNNSHMTTGRLCLGTSHSGLT